MININKGLLAIPIISQILCGVAFGYEIETHRLLNTSAYDYSTIDEYFHEELGYRLFDTGENKGRIDDTFQGFYAIDLFRQAGVDEDSPDTVCFPLPFLIPPIPYPRAHNHYHDPLRSWEDAGYTNPLWYNGISNALWAQYNRLQTPPSDLAVLRCTGPNVWTWDSAYQFFLGGLTGQEDTRRNENLGFLFTTLGHLTHLVADVSVPEHSRNDAHVFKPHFESWCATNLPNVNSPIDGERVFDNTFMPAPGIFAQGQANGIFGSDNLSPVSNLWDSRSSGSGYNPLLSSTERLAGLADYSNDNYFSGDTVFDNVRYPHPNKDEVGLNLLPVAARDGTTDYVYFFHRNTSDGISVAHLAATGFHYQDLLDQGLENAYQAAHVDEYCWKDYAKNLVPRAVSYGTARRSPWERGRRRPGCRGRLDAVLASRQNEVT